ncbi:MAG: hypothetical protein KGP28_10820 [Bdellovibrionales bacterium]|nr:hypothetical protein [Bdellovibrionales bacterium]
MNQSKRMGWMYLFLAFLGLSSANIARGQYLNANPECVVSKITDERVPFPLRKANTKFELSENETYLLNGTIVSMNGRTYFKVDFATQPWLETERMLQFPYLLVDDSSVPLGQYNGRMVQMAVVARKADQSSISEGGAGSVKLEVILPPGVIRY